MRQLAFAGTLLAAVTLVACASSEGTVDKPRLEMSAAEIAELPQFKIRARHGPAPRGLIVHDIRKGSGAVMKPGDAMLLDWGEAVYGEAGEASPHREGQPQELTFDGVLEGWEEGMPGMRVGGRRELIVPPRLGDTGVTMIYQIDLLGIEPGGVADF